MFLAQRPCNLTVFGWDSSWSSHIVSIMEDRTCSRRSWFPCQPLVEKQELLSPPGTLVTWNLPHVTRLFELQLHPHPPPPLFRTASPSGLPGGARDEPGAVNDRHDRQTRAQRGPYLVGPGLVLGCPPRQTRTGMDDVFFGDSIQ